ncbi:MAG: hypothetical protein QOE55_1913 [Acidobacteriaceae bacterium]|nr:hypothetical protein [Acidobacteriaceae bacterium]
MRKATVLAVAFVSDMAPISSVANWRNWYARILRGFLKWNSRSGRHSVATFFLHPQQQAWNSFVFARWDCRSGKDQEKAQVPSLKVQTVRRPLQMAFH